MKNYIEEVLRTESQCRSGIGIPWRLLHAALGIATEAGEFADIIKKRIFYTGPLDKAHLIEELGDILWYVALACDYLGVSFDGVQRKNIAKLKVRYGSKFTAEAAQHGNRDIDAEQNVMKDTMNVVRKESEK